MRIMRSKSVVRTTVYWNIANGCNNAKRFYAVNMNRDWEGLCTVAAAEIEATASALPKPLRARAEKLPVAFERRPNMELQADGIEADTLGLFIGAELAEEGDVPLPSQIILFLENLWDFAGGNEADFREEVRTTFLHELG